MSTSQLPRKLAIEAWEIKKMIRSISMLLVSLISRNPSLNIFTGQEAPTGSSIASAEDHFQGQKQGQRLSAIRRLPEKTSRSPWLNILN